MEGLRERKTIITRHHEDTEMLAVYTYLPGIVLIVRYSVCTNYTNWIATILIRLEVGGIK